MFVKESKPRRNNLWSCSNLNQETWADARVSFLESNFPGNCCLLLEWVEVSHWLANRLTIYLIDLGDPLLLSYIFPRIVWWNVVPRSLILLYWWYISFFFSGTSNSLTLMLNTLKNYEHTSWQLVNMNKSCYLVAPNTYADTNWGIKSIYWRNW